MVVSRNHCRAERRRVIERGVLLGSRDQVTRSVACPGESHRTGARRPDRRLGSGHPMVHRGRGAQRFGDATPKTRRGPVDARLLGLAPTSYALRNIEETTQWPTS